MKESEATKIEHKSNDGFEIQERDGKWLVTHPYLDYWIVCSTEEQAETIEEALNDVDSASYRNSTCD